jgi:hypothetical protein
VFFEGKMTANYLTKLDNALEMHTTVNKELVEGFLVGLMKDIKLLVGPKYKLQTVNLFAHNAGLFDLHVIMQRLVSFHNNPQGLMPQVVRDSKNDIFSLSIMYEGVTLNFLDSMKVLPMSLKAVAKNLLKEGDEKFVVEHDVLREILQSADRRNLLST